MQRRVVAIVLAWCVIPLGERLSGQQATSIAVIKTSDRSDGAAEAARREVDAKVLKRMPGAAAEVWQIDASEASELDKMLAAGTLSYLEVAPGTILPALPAASVDFGALTVAQQDRFTQLVGKLPASEYRISAARPLNLSSELLHTGLSSGVVQINLLGGKAPLFRPLGEISAAGVAGFTWQGAMLGSHGDATLLVKPDGITGVVNVAGESYSITPLGDGQHVITKSTQEGQLPDHPPDAQRPKPEGDGDVALCTAAEREADVLVLYTPKAKELLPSIVKQEPEWAFSTLALTLKASDARAEVRLVAIREVNYVETASMQTDVNNISNLPEVLKAQKETGADLVVTYLGDGRGCGWSKTIGVDKSPTDGYAVLRIPSRSCPRERFTFAHEVGHLYGLRHEVADDAGNPYDFGHAFAVEGDARDVMGTDKICNGCLRTTLYSNPRVMRNNKPFGDPARADNARVIRDFTGKIVPRIACRP